MGGGLGRKGERIGHFYMLSGGGKWEKNTCRNKDIGAVDWVSFQGRKLNPKHWTKIIIF